jgi:hypothetical protein
MDVKIMRTELMRFSKEELVTELLAALVELASRTKPKVDDPGRPVPPHGSGP